MNKKFVISLRKNVRVAEYANTSKGNYDVVSYKPFRSFKTRAEARAYKAIHAGTVIVNTTTQQVVR